MSSLKDIQNEIYQLEKDVQYLTDLGAVPSIPDDSWEKIKKERKKKMKQLQYQYNKEDEILHSNRLK